MNELRAAHIAAQAGLFEPQRSNNGLIRFIGVPGDNKNLGSGESVLTLSLNGFAMPNITVEPIELRWLNERKRVAGLVSFEDMEVTFKDYVDTGTAQVIKLWHEQVYDPVTGKVGLARVYKKPGIIELFAPDGSHSRYHLCVGCWPTTLNLGAIDMTSAETMLLTMTLSIDKAYAAPDYKNATLIASKLASLGAAALGAI